LQYDNPLRRQRPRGKRSREDPVRQELAFVNRASESPADNASQA